MFDSFTEDYDFPPYRPPNEAASALIRVTRGCPWNRCQFCTMYKDLKFHIRDIENVKKDIDTAARIYKGSKSVFIADSDSLVHKDIVEIIEHISSRFPDIDRMTSYARARTLRMLGAEKLAKINKAGLTRVHIGLESGDGETLKFLDKGITPEMMIVGGKAAKEGGIKFSFYVLIGAGGKERLAEHAMESARVCNEANPDFIRLRTLVVQHGSLLEEKLKAGSYTQTSPLEKLEEVKLFLESLEVTDCEFASDHFTNNIWLDNRIIYNGIYGHLPLDKESMLAIVESAIVMINSSDSEPVDATILYDRGMISSL